jgi:transposase
MGRAAVLERAATFGLKAAHRVIDTGRSVVDVATELSVADGSLARWARDERRRMETVAGGSDEPLSAAERSELLRLRRQVAEQDKDQAFLGKTAVVRAGLVPMLRAHVDHKRTNSPSE